MSFCSRNLAVTLGTFWYQLFSLLDSFFLGGSGGNNLRKVPTYSEMRQRLQANQPSFYAFSNSLTDRPSEYQPWHFITGSFSAGPSKLPSKLPGRAQEVREGRVSHRGVWERCRFCLSDPFEPSGFWFRDPSNYCLIVSLLSFQFCLSSCLEKSFLDGHWKGGQFLQFVFRPAAMIFTLMILPFGTPLTKNMPKS